jgi:hypothetical protein
MMKLIVAFSQFCESAQKRTSKATAGYKSGEEQVRFVCIPQANEVNYMQHRPLTSCQLLS